MFMNKIKFISSTLMLFALTQFPLLVHAEAKIKPTCDAGSGAGSGFYFNKQNFMGGNLAVLYPKAIGGRYDNSQLPLGRHCLPLPAPGAPIHVCVRHGDHSVNCIDSYLDVDQAVELACADDGSERDQSIYVTCGWHTTPQRRW